MPKRQPRVFIRSITMHCLRPRSCGSPNRKFALAFHPGPKSQQKGGFPCCTQSGAKATNRSSIQVIQLAVFWVSLQKRYPHEVWFCSVHRCVPSVRFLQECEERTGSVQQALFAASFWGESKGETDLMLDKFSLLQHRIPCLLVAPPFLCT